jgi:type II secretory pathway component GspD/PulD (secretin)
MFLKTKTFLPVFLAYLLFIGASYKSAFAGDSIDIDLGVSKNTTNSSTPFAQTPIFTKSTVITTHAQNNGNKISLSNEKTSISKIILTPKEENLILTLWGRSLSEPQISKNEDGKVLIKFLETQLNIKSVIKTDNPVITTIRSSDHDGTAWVVLDNKGLGNWSVTRSADNINISFTTVLSPNANKNSKTDKTVMTISPLTTNSTVTASADVQNTEIKNYSRLIEASVKPIENGVKLIMTSDSPSKYIVRKLSQPDKLIIHFLNTRLEVNEKSRKYKNDDMELKKGGLLSIEMRQLPPAFSPTSEALLTLLPGTVYEVDRNLNQVIIKLTAPQPVINTLVKRGNLNQLVSLDIENADLNVVLRTLASEAGFDVDFLGGSLAGTVNEKFKDLPLKTALALLLAPNSYAYDLQGNTLRFGPQASIKSQKDILPHVTEILNPSGGMTPAQFDTLVRSILLPTNDVKTTPDTVRNVLILNGTVADIDDYKKTIQDLKLDEGATSDRITKVVRLNYADPPSAALILHPYLSPVGQAQVDARTNSLIIWEVASNMGVLLELIKEFDVKIPQVLVESNIVEVDSENDLDLGVNWTFQSVNPSANPTFNAGVSLPAGGGAPPNFQFGTIRSGLNISATLNALESHNKGKIISRPKIATGSGIPAEINVVENVVLQSTTSTIASNGFATFTTSYTNLPLPIDLKVTPRITDDGRITSIINASITSQTGPALGTGALPPTSVETATSTLTTKNGETIVIGGLMRETMTDSTSGVPILSSIPIIGTLFQSRSYTKQKVELVIFITPTLMID